MKSKISKMSPYLMVNDLFEDLSEENKRLNNELMFANNCLNVLNEFKTLLTKIYLKFEANIDSEDKQLFKRLEDDFSSLSKTELNRSESNNGNCLQITGDIKEVTEKTIDLKNETIEENSKKVNLKRHPLLGKRKRSKIGGTRRQRKPRSSEPKPKPTIKEIPEPEDEPNSMLLLKRDNFDPKTSSYVCPNPNCNKSYGSKNNLWLHFYGVHHKQKEYFCDHFNCNKGFKTFNELRAHSITHSEIKPFVCDVKGCDFRSKRRDAVDKHMVTHTDNRPFKCSVCEKCFKTQRGLQLHEKRHKSEPSYVCHFEDCRQSFQTSSQLRNHKILIHKLVYKTKIFECDWPGCDFTTRNYESAVERHKLRVHIEERKHKCDKCGKVFKFKEILTRHGLVHKSEPSIKCTVEGCTQFLKNAYQLDKHRKLVHNINNETIYCDWPGCEYQTEYSRNLRAHKMVHIGERRHNCDWPDCDKSFLRKQQLRTHYRVHQNLKPFGCVWPGCQQTFRQTGHLKRHVKNVHQKIPRVVYVFRLTMASSNRQKGVYIKVNDVFEELSEENKRLNNELMFANNCLNVLNKFKTLLNKICIKFEIIIDSEDKQELNQLEEEFGSVMRFKEQMRDENNRKWEQNNEKITDCFEENTNDSSEDVLEIFARNVKKNTETKKRNNEKNLFGSELLEFRRTDKSSEDSRQTESALEDMDSNFGGSDGNSSQRNSIRQLYRENRIAKYSCSYPDCGHRFDRPQRLNEHLKQRHVFHLSYKCQECNDQFYTDFDLKEHQLVHSAYSYECEECHKLFERPSLLNRHKGTHIKRPPNKELHAIPTQCDFEGCNKMFRNVLRMRAHKKDVHRKERIVCDWPGCGKTFKHKKTLWSHKHTHSGNFKYKCEVDGCDKEFTLKCSFQGHMKYHQRSFICTWPDCGKGFISEAERSGHLNRHLDVRPFKCSVETCRNEYYTYSSLRGHVFRIHNIHMSQLNNSL